MGILVPESRALSVLAIAEAPASWCMLGITDTQHTHVTCMNYLLQSQAPGLGELEKGNCPDLGLLSRVLRTEEARVPLGQELEKRGCWFWEERLFCVTRRLLW